MKLKKTILGLAVVAVAGVNAWLANDVNARNNVLSMLNLENVADASECFFYIESNSDGTYTKAYCDENIFIPCCQMKAEGRNIVVCRGNYVRITVG